MVTRASPSDLLFNRVVVNLPPSPSGEFARSWRFPYFISPRPYALNFVSISYAMLIPSRNNTIVVEALHAARKIIKSDDDI